MGRPRNHELKEKNKKVNKKLFYKKVVNDDNTIGFYRNNVVYDVDYKVWFKIENNKLYDNKNKLFGYKKNNNLYYEDNKYIGTIKTVPKLLILFFMIIIILLFGTFSFAFKDILFNDTNDHIIIIPPEQDENEDQEQEILEKEVYIDILSDFLGVDNDGKKLIAPGSESSSYFKVYNQGHKTLKYTIKIEDNNPNYELPMKFRLKQNNKYIVGDLHNWVNIDKLYQKDLILNSKSQFDYILEWKWDKDIDNTIDTKYGIEGALEYNLKIKITITE